jgi:hypothetical protein
MTDDEFHEWRKGLEDDREERVLFAKNLSNRLEVFSCVLDRSIFMLVAFIANQCGYFDPEYVNQERNGFFIQVPPILYGAILHFLGIHIAKIELKDSRGGIYYFYYYEYNQKNIIKM